MKKYVAKEPILFDGKQHKIGEAITLSDDQAEPLIAINHVELSEGEQTAAPTALTDEQKLVLVKDGISKLNVDTKENWLKDGRPNTSALTAIVKFDVTAAVRDAAWEEVKPKVEAATPAATAEAAPAATTDAGAKPDASTEPVKTDSTAA